MKTMDLLNKALEQHPAPYWTKKLNLSRGALHTAKTRGSLSPAIAGALAEELGEPVKDWIVIAALEGERESACKTKMLKRFTLGAALAVAALGASAHALTEKAPQVFEKVQISQYVYYVQSKKATHQLHYRTHGFTRWL